MTILYFDIETIPAPEDKKPFLERVHESKLAKESENSYRPTVVYKNSV